MEKIPMSAEPIESVDDGSPSWVTSQKWTDNKIQAVSLRVNSLVKFKMFAVTPVSALLLSLLSKITVLSKVDAQ